MYFDEPVDSVAPAPVADDLSPPWSSRVTQPPVGPGLAARLQAALGPQYELGPEIGRGGMGIVFLARDTTLARDVAVKAVHPELAIHSSIAQRFLAEARMIARLRHPNIVTVYTAGEAGDLLYYVMDRVPGDSLRERLTRDGRLPTDEARRITMDIAAALDAAAGAGLVHRDVKPENILIEAGTGRALLADFGIARALAVEPAGSRSGPVTGQGMVVGTPNYMSPEQAAGEDVDSRSDLYSLGTVAYEMVAGHPPFVGPNRVVVSKHISEPPVALGRVRPECPAGPGQRHHAHAGQGAGGPVPDRRRVAGRPGRDPHASPRLRPGPAAARGRGRRGRARAPRRDALSAAPTGRAACRRQPAPLHAGPALRQPPRRGGPRLAPERQRQHAGAQHVAVEGHDGGGP